MGVKVPVGEVSVMPQPSASRVPVSSVKRLPSSTGRGAPPELHSLSERRSCLGVSGSLISAVNIVGTPANTVTFWLLMSARAAFGSKRMCWITSAARRTPSSMFTVSA